MAAAFAAGNGAAGEGASPGSSLHVRLAAEEGDVVGVGVSHGLIDLIEGGVVGWIGWEWEWEGLSAGWLGGCEVGGD